MDDEVELTGMYLQRLECLPNPPVSTTQNRWPVSLVGEE
jgi:hypothetical protein